MMNRLKWTSHHVIVSHKLPDVYHFTRNLGEFNNIEVCQDYLKSSGTHHSDLIALAYQLRALTELPGGTPPYAKALASRTHNTSS